METKEFYVPVLTESQYIKRLIMNSRVPFFFLENVKGVTQNGWLLN